MKQKSLIFILLILAAAAVVFFLVQQNADQIPSLTTPSVKVPEGPVIESTNVTTFDTELEQEIETFDEDLLDLDKLEKDSSLNNIDKDLADFSL